MYVITNNGGHVLNDYSQYRVEPVFHTSIPLNPSRDSTVSFILSLVHHFHPVVVTLANAEERLHMPKFV